MAPGAGKDGDMDFEMPAEVLDFRKQVQDFIAAHRTPELDAEIAESHIHGYGPASQGFMRAMAQEGFAAVSWPEEYGGQGKGRALPVDPRRGVRARGRAVRQPHLHLRRPEHHAQRHGGAEAGNPAQGAEGRDQLRPRIHRAERRHRPRLAADARRPRRRRVGDQRAEDLHLVRPPRDARLARGADRAGCAEAPRHLDLRAAAQHPPASPSARCGSWARAAPTRPSGRTCASPPTR